MRRKFLDKVIWKIPTKRKEDEIIIIMQDREHPDAHVHAIVKGEKDSFDICTGNSIHGVITGKNAQTIKRWILANQTMLKLTWNSMYPKFPIRDAAHSRLRHIDALSMKLDRQLHRFERLVKILGRRYSFNYL